MFCVDLRQSYEGTAVHRPAFELWELIDSGLAIEHRARAAGGKTHTEQCFDRSRDPTWVFEQICGVFFELNKGANGSQCVSEDKTGAVESSEQIADHREAAASDVFEQNRRTATFTDATVDFGGFKVRANLAFHPQQLPCAV
jgi:hypothetical protein